jgi:hypothetical protein
MNINLADYSDAEQWFPGRFWAHSGIGGNWAAKEKRK